MVFGTVLLQVPTNKSYFVQLNAELKTTSYIQNNVSVYSFHTYSDYTHLRSQTCAREPSCLWHSGTCLCPCCVCLSWVSSRAAVRVLTGCASGLCGCWMGSLLCGWCCPLVGRGGEEITAHYSQCQPKWFEHIP